MKRPLLAARLALAIVLAVLIAGCGAGAAGPGETTPTTTTPSTTTTTPDAGRPVTFAADDGVGLIGRVFGTGTAAVVLSNMGDNDPGPWQEFAPALSERGYLVLTYSFRYPLRTNSFTETMAVGTVADLRGAVAFVRGLGATRVVLIGASLGGITVGKVAGTVGAAAAVVISAEQDLSDYGLVVTPAELATMTCPKLFVASEQDTNTPFADTRAYFEHAPEPKQFRSFSGSTHGVRIFATGHGAELHQLLVDFVTAAVPAH